MNQLLTKQLSGLQQEFCRPATNSDFVSRAMANFPKDVPKAAAWILSERVKRGWSTTLLARKAREIAQAEGDQIKLAQQLISSFEQAAKPGKDDAAKRMPSWIKFAAKAFEIEPVGTKVLASTARAEPQFVRLAVALPSVDVLTELLHAAIDSSDMPDIADELAPKLARRLPDLLERALDHVPARQQPAETTTSQSASRGRPGSSPAPRNG